MHQLTKTSNWTNTKIKQKSNWTHKQVNKVTKQANKQTKRQMHKSVNKWSSKQTNAQRSKQTWKQANKNRQPNKQTNSIRWYKSKLQKRTLFFIRSVHCGGWGKWAVVLCTMSLKTELGWMFSKYCFHKIVPDLLSMPKSWVEKQQPYVNRKDS